MRVLFLAPSFLSRRRESKPLRGVELFDLHLLAQLPGEGVEVCVPAESCWRETLMRQCPDIEALFLPGFRRCGFSGILAAILLRRRRFDAILLGNNARGLLWGLRVLRPRARGIRVLLLAHREARPAFQSALSHYAMEVIAVSDAVARTFVVDGRGPRRLETCYGIPDADRFTPADMPPAADDGIVRFGVLGRLDNPWKGADLAIDAFVRLPASIRERAELHLAAFDEPPNDLPRGVIAYPWLAPSDVPGFLRSLDVYLACSHAQETFGQAVVQAMLCGLPIVSTGLEVFREKLDAGGGLVGEHPRQFRAHMERLARDPSLRAQMGAIARRTALERYVWSTREFVERFLRSTGAEAEASMSP